MAFIFKKKTERGMEIMRERNRRYLEEYEEQHLSDEEKAARAAAAEREEEDPAYEMGKNYAFRTDAPPEDGEYIPEREDVELEKGDIFAIILSSFLVFWPVFLVLLVILGLTVWWIVRS